MTVYTIATIVAFALAILGAYVAVPRINRARRAVDIGIALVSPHPGREPGRCAGRCDTCAAKLTNDRGFIYCAACTSDQLSDCYRSPYQGGGVA